MGWSVSLDGIEEMGAGGLASGRKMQWTDVKWWVSLYRECPYNYAIFRLLAIPASAQDPRDPGYGKRHSAAQWPSAKSHRHNTDTTICGNITTGMMDLIELPDKPGNYSVKVEKMDSRPRPKRPLFLTCLLKSL